jgi:prenyltransferase beta subunit
MDLTYLNRAINFLIAASTYIESQQTNNGWVYELKKKECCYITAQAILALCKTRNLKSPNLVKAAEFLKKNRNPDKGWGRTPTPKKSDVQSTSLCCLAISKILGMTAEVMEGLRWLLKKQNEDGSFQDLTRKKGTVKAATHSLYALGNFQARVPPDTITNAAITNALKWLEMHQIAKGGWGNIPGEEDTSSCTASVLEVITEFGWYDIFNTEKYKSAKEWLLTRQTEKGFFADIPRQYDTEATAYTIISLLNDDLSPEESTITTAFDWLVNMQQDNGSLPEEDRGVVRDICPAADGINAISKWIHKYLENNPFILIENLEYLNSVEFGIESKRIKEFHKTAEEKTRKSIINLKFFRYEWGKKEIFERKK